MSGGYDPIVVAHFLDLDRFFATAAVSGQEVEATIAQLTQGGVGAIRATLTEQLEIPRLTGAEMTLLTTEAHANIFEPSRLLNTRVQLLLGFAELDYSDYLPIFTGIVDRYQIGYTTLRLSLTDSIIAHNVTAAVPVGAPYFLGAPSASTSTRVPLLLGTVTDAPTLALTSEATGTLALDMSAADTTLFLTEFGAPFPDSGIITLETETQVRYTTREVVTLDGHTVLALGGLLRSAAASHSVGAAVTLQVQVWEYLIGYEVGTVVAVREGGVLVSPTEYTVVTSEADRAVTVLQFATPRGTVTVDVIASNVDTTNLLTNGGFETGDTTGWTEASGGSLDVGTGQPVGGEQVSNGGFETGDGTDWTEDNGGVLTVGTSSPTPVAGTYRGALTGGVGSYGDLYQDITTVPGNVYAWRFWYQDAQAFDTPLVTNGDFESGDLTGWTTTSDHSPLASVQSTVVAEGTWALAVTGDATDTRYLDWRYTLTQTLTTTPAASYTLSFQYRTSYDTANGGPISSSLQVLVRDVAGSGLAILAAFPPQTSNAWRRVSYTFTAVSATTTLTVVGSGGRPTLVEPYLPLWLDGVVVAAALDQTTTAYQLGTPGIPTLYAHATLDFAENWTTVAGTFAATDTTTRLRLRSQSASTPLATAFDEVSVVPTVSYDVLPFEGTSRAQLTGNLGDYGEAYQEFATEVGQLYHLALVYRNALDHVPNAVVNGSFESGDLSGWTLGSATQVEVSVFKIEPWFNAFPHRDGSYLVQFFSSDGVDYPQAELYQDIPVSTGVPYHLTWLYASGSLLRIGITLGTPSDPEAYVPLTPAPILFTSGDVVPGPSATITPTSSPVRLTLRVTSAYRHSIETAYADLVTLSLVELPTDQAAYQLGTPTVPDFYASADPLPTTYAWKQLGVIFKATETTTRLTLRSQYPVDPQPSYFDALAVIAGSGGLNPAEAIQTVIATFLPTATINTQSFLDAHVALLDWSFSGVSTVVTDVETLLHRLARQCGSLLLKDPEDQYSLVPLTDDRPVVFAFGTHNIITPSMSRESSPQDAIYTEYYVYFGVRTGGNSSASDFTSVTYATPFATNVPGGDLLQSRCRVARAVYGKDQRLDLFCEWIQDLATANLLLAWAVQRYTTSPDVVSFATWLDALPVPMGAVVAVKHPVLQYGGARALAEVIGWQFQPQQMQVALTARLLPYAQNILDLTLEDVTVDLEVHVEPLVDPCAGTDYTTALVAHWYLEETSGTRVDSVGGYDLTDFFGVGQRAGLVGSAAVFSGDGLFGGTDCWLSNGTTSAFHLYPSHDHAGDLVLSPTDSFTVCCWVQLDSLSPSQQAFVSLSNCQIYRVSSSVFFEFRTLGTLTSSISASHSFSPGAWVFVAAVFDASSGGQMFLKIDGGTLVGPTTPASPPSSPDLGITFGTNPGGGAPLQGALDDVALWVGRVLTQDELDCIYNAGAGRLF
jgi:hypothetical protein